MQIFKIKLYKVRALAAAVTAAAVLWTASPAFARLDELIVEDAPYISPPVITVSAPQAIYQVKAGETLSEIARRNGLTVESLAAANNLPDHDRIHAGQVLKVPSDCVVHCVKPGETLSDIARMYMVDLSVIGSRNGLSNLDRIAVGQKINVPYSARGAGLTYVSASLADLPPLSWPLLGAVTSRFGIRDGRPHEGVDIAVEEGTPVRVTSGGRVIFAGPRGTYGLAVIVDHGGGVRTLYAHCSRLVVTEGRNVDAGAIIALSGNTGRSTGPHLHLEVRKNGVPLDPLPYLESTIYYG
ncbi:peptidoglycan DD-metalloendopeptidase family protein [Pelotomaculum propionicicum]|uniref:peptidoglycan DD-metalloendopeptidase family protein n=1 Tax=Pelotomaculum propionicicum TaxID=258475 RepID=UPI003B7C9D4E